MNHAGELTPLSQLVRPDVAIITTIAPAHTGILRERSKQIADAKAEIFNGMRGGTAVLNRDNAHFDRLAAMPLRPRPRTASLGFGAHARGTARFDN